MNAIANIGFSSPTAGYDQPIEMWLGCHHRIARMSSLLQRLVDHLKYHPVDRQAGITAASIRRYFEEAAPRHHEDEEIDLFPRLLEKLRDQPDAPATEKMDAAIRSLRSDHVEMHDLWLQMRARLLEVEAGKDPRFDDAQVMLFVTRYRAHIEIEDGLLAPAFKRLFKARDLREIGRAMAARRGVDWEAVVERTQGARNGAPAAKPDRAPRRRPSAAKSAGRRPGR
jgi:hemerythrin-like domain-containing protein